MEEPFDEMDSTLAVQQYIQQTIRRWTNHDVDRRKFKQIVIALFRIGR